MMGSRYAVVSARSYANNLHRHKHLIIRVFTGQMLFLTPNQQCQNTEGSAVKTECVKRPPHVSTLSIVCVPASLPPAASAVVNASSISCLSLSLRS